MTGLDFGPLVLGGNVFGWTADRDAGFAVLDAFVDAGGRAIDTADVYSAWVPGNSGGDSERMVGEWLGSRGRRDDVVLATKVGMWEARPGLSRANITAAVEESLGRLGTDRIDLYYAHRDDPAVPQEETLEAFDALVRRGDVREIGASNFAPDRIRSAAALAEENGLVAYTVAQDQWNLVERDAEIDLVPTLQELGVVELPYAALAAGFLTGKYRAGSAVDSPRAGRAGGYLDDPRNVDLLEVLEAVAADHGVSMTAIALAWLRDQPAVAAPIASARSVEQLQDLVASFAVRLTAQQRELLSATTGPVGG